MHLVQLNFVLSPATLKNFLGRALEARADLARHRSRTRTRKVDVAGLIFTDVLSTPQLGQESLAVELSSPMPKSW